MDDGPLLLKAILLEPEEDTPRLMYADWLEESGDGESAAFVRNCLASDPLRQNQCQLPSEALERKWLGKVQLYCTHCSYYKGMLYSVDMADNLLFSSPYDSAITDLFRRHPIQKVQFDRMSQYGF